MSLATEELAFLDGIQYADFRSEEEIIKDALQDAYDAGAVVKTDDYAKRAKEYEARVREDYADRNVFIPQGALAEQFRLGVVAESVESRHETQETTDVLPEDKYLDLLDDNQFKRTR